MTNHIQLLNIKFMKYREINSIRDIFLQLIN